MISACSKSFKLWHRQDGKPFAAIESEDDICDVAWFTGTGMFCFANEGQKMKTYFIPELGPAPQWCWFLDNLTEELEENLDNTVYDDYKFVTKEDLESLGLDHLMGTNFLRAYMHGFFIDMRLYHKAKEIVNPFAFDEYKKDLINRKLKEQIKDRVDVKKLPKVNKSLAKKDIIKGSKLLEDERFSSLFNNPDFEVDQESEQYKLINPTVKKHEKDFTEYIIDDDVDEDSDDEDFKEHLRSLRTLKKKRQMKIVSCENSKMELVPLSNSTKAKPLGERFHATGNTFPKHHRKNFGPMEMQTGDKEGKYSEKQNKQGQHIQERRTLGRSARGIMRKQKGKFWRGRKVG